MKEMQKIYKWERKEHERNKEELRNHKHKRLFNYSSLDAGRLK